MKTATKSRKVVRIETYSVTAWDRFAERRITAYSGLAYPEAVRLAIGFGDQRYTEVEIERR